MSSRNGSSFDLPRAVRLRLRRRRRLRLWLWLCVKVSAISRYYVHRLQLNIKDKMQPNVKTLRLTAFTLPPSPPSPSHPPALLSLLCAPPLRVRARASSG